MAMERPGMGSIPESYPSNPTDPETHTQIAFEDKTVARLRELASDPKSETFTFLRDFVQSDDPSTEAVWGPSEDRLANIQFSIDRKALVLPSKRIVPVRYGTWTSDVRFGSTENRKLNEDALLVRPFGKDRLLVAAFDGANSQQAIKGLDEAYGVKGSWYVSKLAALGFPVTTEYRKLESDPNTTAYDFTVALNKWLQQELSKIEGVDYQDVLSLPGMAATLAIVDYAKGNISVAHIADTIGIAEYMDGHNLITDNKNERWDRETMEVLDSIAKANRISRRNANENPEINQKLKEHLKASFRKKINKPGGTGILNGMPELVSNGLIQVAELSIADDLRLLHLATDGVHMAWMGREDIDEETKIRKILGALDNPHYRPGDVIHEVVQRLEMDPEHTAIGRLGSHDDATYITVDFKGDNVPLTPYRIENQKLLRKDPLEIARVIFDNSH